MKKILALLLAVSMILALGACSFDYTSLHGSSNSNNSQSNHVIPTLPPYTTPTEPDYSSDNPTHYVSLSMFENFGIVGDSFACGAIFVKQEDGTYTGGTYEELSWGQIMARKLGTNCTNFSWGGLSTRTWLTASRGLQALLTAEPQDIYYLMLGINDKNAYDQEDFGSVEDLKENFLENPDTFYGNYGKIIGYIQDHAPDAKIIMSTMAGSAGLNKKFNDAIEEIAAHFGIPCVRQYEHEFFNSDYYRNNLIYAHPTAPIYSGMANALQDLFENAVYKNMSYFEDYIG